LKGEREFEKVGYKQGHACSKWKDKKNGEKGEFG